MQQQSAQLTQQQPKLNRYVRCFTWNMANEKKLDLRGSPAAFLVRN